VPAQYQSAVVAGDHVFRAANPGIIRCFNMQTGQQKFAERAPGVPTVCSPFATADDRVYFASPDKTYVLRAAARFEVLAVNELGGGGNCSSAAVSGGRIFLRGDQTLFCIGK
jgi:outer membrane protein assembly factor BamB